MAEPVQVESAWSRHAEAWPSRAVRQGCLGEAIASRRAVNSVGARGGEVDAEPPRRGLAIEAGGAFSYLITSMRSLTMVPLGAWYRRPFRCSLRIVSSTWSGGKV